MLPRVILIYPAFTSLTGTQIGTGQAQFEGPISTVKSVVQPLAPKSRRVKRCAEGEPGSPVKLAAPPLTAWLLGELAPEPV